MDWLGRYEVPLPIRCRGAFHSYATRDGRSGEARFVIVPAAHAAPAPARERIARLARAHGAAHGAGLPEVAEHGEHHGVAFVAFACDAACDGEAVIAHLGETGTRVPYAEAAAAVDRMTSALASAHASVDPTTGAPAAMGALSWANVVVERDGSILLVGLGHNVVARTEHDALSGAPSVFIPPEVAAGAPATPGADAYAIVMLQRSVLSYTALPPALDRTFRGEPAEGDAPVAAIVQWSNEHVVTAPPSRRPSMDRLRAQAAREWQLLGITPDHAALRARIASIVEARENPAALQTRDASDAVTLGPDGAWLRAPGGETYPLDGRSALRRILVRMAEAWRATPGERLGVDALLEAGWPGERPIREAGLNRVYVAISSLRKMGLRDVIQRDDRGYRIDPGVRVRFEGVDP